jgi:g-D-glutamyl-meso-diaminopimelate peptidase
METLFIGSTGPDVKLLQAVLNTIGYSAGPVSGAFGPETRQAVVAFQSAFGLTIDGVVGPQTWAALEPFLLGYFTYTIRPGDTLWKIAQRYDTTIDAIVTANPGLDPDYLVVARRIVVPFGYDLVFSDIDYTYDIMQRIIRGLNVRYPFLEVGSIGQSVMGKDLTLVQMGFGDNHVSYNASHHANESITTPVLLKFIERASKAYATNTRLGDYDMRDLFARTRFSIIPMVNPDGVDLVAYWPNYTNPAYSEAEQLNRTGLPLPSVWKANIRGTDLNLNYPAGWENQKEEELEQGITGPGPRDYGGPSPLSEPETQAMAAFTRANDFRLVIAYHTQGEVIFYTFNNLQPPESRPIADLFGQVSGYAVSENPTEASWAGYKDWFIQDFGRPGFTVEAGLGVNPIPMTQFNRIYEQNEELLILGGYV